MSVGGADAWSRSATWLWNGAQMSITPNVYRDWETDSSGRVEQVLVSGTNNLYDQHSWLETFVSDRLTINSGGNLGAGYTQSARSFIALKGQVQCFTSWNIGLGVAWTETYVRIRDATLPGTPIVQEKFQDAARCMSTGNHLLDGTWRTDSDSITFQAGHEYWIETGIRSTVFTQDRGFAKADFLDNTAGYQADVSFVEVPNQAPIVTNSPIARTWYPYNLVFGVRLAGQMCDYDGTIRTGTIRTHGLYAYPPSYAQTADAACANPSFTTTYLYPAWYRVEFEAEDSDGSLGRRHDLAMIDLYPSSGASVGGHMLDLPPTRPTETVVVEGIFTPEGQAVELEFRPLLGPLISAERTDGLHRLAAIFNPVGMTVEISVDGVVRWAGPVEQRGEDWWDLVPSSAALSVTGASH